MRFKYIMEDLTRWSADGESIFHRSGIFYSSLLLYMEKQIIINLILLKVKSKDYIVHLT